MADERWTWTSVDPKLPPEKLVPLLNERMKRLERRIAELERALAAVTPP